MESIGITLFGIVTTLISIVAEDQREFKLIYDPVLLPGAGATVGTVTSL